MELKTPLYEKHVESGGKIVPFAGYLLPVQYESGVINEHMSVRTKAGLFDVSHMGEVYYTGKDALANINMLLTNDFTNMKIGQVRYSPMCNEEGGVLDDLLVYKVGEDEYLIVVNAGNRFKDVKWMKQKLFGDVTFTDRSDKIAQIALQGPAAPGILAKVADKPSIPIKYYTFIDNANVGGISCLVSRTGYTGELGYEIYVAAENAVKIWDLLIEAGRDFGLIPCGLGARDTLRLEAGMPLYGHEMDETISPLETGLDFGVKMNKADFIGKKGIEAKLPLTRKRVGLKITGRGIVREHEKVYCGNKSVGYTTSGTHCPYFKKALAMAILEIDYTEPGTALEVDVRGRRIPVEIIELPFYKRD
ncbi:MAG: glycine cleavage system aminomethyltransferase GcvT [Clostridia bacterium]|jgi:aminomethyltransferase|nr:glycine cleavage system aminomethyltransferase GcvT [Clostridia bacterium]